MEPFPQRKSSDSESSTSTDDEFVDGVKHEDEEVNSDEDGSVEESVTVSSKVVVRNFPKKATSTVCETFLEQFEGVSMVKREEVIVKKEATLQVFKKGSYEVTFINRESAVKFASLQEVKFGKRVLSKQLLHSCNKC
jgi:hypothetical protein